jgi:hypothetical protein
MTKVTDQTPIATPNVADVLHVVDVSDNTQDPAGSSRKMTLQQVVNLTAANLATVATSGSYDDLGDKLTNADIKTQYEANSNTNAYTDAEKSKLAGLEDQKFLGTYTSLSALQTAHPSPAVGSFAHVDAGVGNSVETYAWDDSDDEYVLQGSSSTSETASSVKSKYESNADTNAFTDAEKSKLTNVETNATADQTDTEIETAYNNRVSQISAAEITDGTATGIRRYSPANVKALIDTHTSSKINSDTTGVTGADSVTNIISLTQAEYDAITPDASTLYLIT